MSGKKTFRCAIYTRKSTEEGLDQDFNSLDAQREACEAFVASQTGLGWTVLAERYDDGGFSGGTMERPGLQSLLADIKAGTVDVVVVYKIDRLTRSLMDFARIVEIFDNNACSFVSVTQAFNTTTSMGRLTLNVLLSFAQFEREVTAERIRDKIAASKKKGMWMGGVVPLGYAAKDRKLVVNADEAETVKALFERYLDLKSVPALKAEIDRGGFGNRNRTDITTPRSIGPGVSRGRLYTLLANPVYIGKLRHRGQLHDGEHDAIVPTATFDAAQALLAKQAPQRQSATNQDDTHWLTGLLFDDSGERLSPAHATKTGRRYRYYVSEGLKRGERRDDRGWRIPAQRLDALAEQQLQTLLTDRQRLAGWIEDAASSDRIEAGLGAAERLATNLWSSEQKDRRKAMLRSVFHRVTVGRDGIRFDVNTSRLVAWLLLENADRDGPMGCDRKHARQEEAPSETALVTIEVPVTLQRRANGNRLVLTDGHARLAEPDRALIGVVARAQLYLKELTNGEGRSIGDVARRHNVHRADVGRLLPLAFLAPDVTEAIISGRHPAELSARRLSRLTDLPLAWRDQAALFGLR